MVSLVVLDDTGSAVYEEDELADVVEW